MGFSEAQRGHAWLPRSLGSLLDTIGKPFRWFRSCLGDEAIQCAFRTYAQSNPQVRNQWERRPTGNLLAQLFWIPYVETGSASGISFVFRFCSNSKEPWISRSSFFPVFLKEKVFLNQLGSFQHTTVLLKYYTELMKYSHFLKKMQNHLYMKMERAQKYLPTTFKLEWYQIKSKLKLQYCH